jgi:L-ascorbate 6-phosphate lactonase
MGGARVVSVKDPSFAEALKVPLADGDLLLWWLGGAGFLLRSADGALLIDLYLTPNGSRRFPPPFRAEDATLVDAVLVTHEHRDHLDLNVVQAFVDADAPARWVVPEPIAGRLADLGIPPPRIVPVQPGHRLELGRINVQPVAAHHGVTMADAYNTGEVISGGLVRFLGYVMELAGTRIYHSGDCLAYVGLAEELARLSVDVVLLPINGRDAEREARDIVGNMSSDEAVTLAGRSGAEVLVPMHWDLLPDNLGEPSKAVAVVERDYSSLTVLLPSRDRPFGLHQVGRRWWPRPGSRPEGD